MSHLNDVIAGDHEDLYQAIGLHLYAICLYRPSDRIHDLTKSVELSERLSLSENAIMARNSLVAAHFAMANELRRSGQGYLSQRHLRLAESLSELNLQQALETSVRAYQAYALTEHAAVQWAVVAGFDGRSGMTPSKAAALGTVSCAKGPGVVDVALLLDGPM